MNGSKAENQSRLEALVAALGQRQDIDMAVFPSMPYVAQCQQILGGSTVAWGAQNVSEHTGGAFTGETSSQMLRDFECRYVLVGHSERRELFAESNQQVAEKFKAAVDSELVPVLCVGETLEQREAGETQRIISEQIEAVLSLVGSDVFANGVVAYEPVWAIGTGKTASPEQAQEVHSAIRAQLAEANIAMAEAMQILYGGSVKPENAAAIFAQQDVDGALVGGASLKAEDFIAICDAAA